MWIWNPVQSLNVGSNGKISKTYISLKQQNHLKGKLVSTFIERSTTKYILFCGVVFAESNLMWEKYYLDGPIILDDFSARSIMLSNWTKFKIFSQNPRLGLNKFAIVILCFILKRRWYILFDPIEYSRWLSLQDLV